MIIVVSNSQDATADYLCSRLKHENLEHIRFDTDTVIGQVELLYKANQFSLFINGITLSPNKVNSVWYRRPERLELNNDSFEEGERLHTISEWSACLEGFLAHIPTELWINHPRQNASASSKLEQLSRARNLGFKIPQTIVTQSFHEALAFSQGCKGNVIVKPISHGYIERSEPRKDTLIFTNEVSLEQLNSNKALLSLCPTLFQEKIEKIYDIRVNILDTNVIAVAIYASEDELQRIDIRRKNMQGVRYKIVSLPPTLNNKILELCHSYRLRFAAVDMAFTKDSEWIFFEINPNGQWAWLDLEGVTDMASLFLQSMQNRSL
jgi:glutathione synthase/RimK-type ligase-like ATP-grasp enzyme